MANEGLLSKKISPDTKLPFTDPKENVVTLDQNEWTQQPGQNNMLSGSPGPVKQDTALAETKPTVPTTATPDYAKITASGVGSLNKLGGTVESRIPGLLKKGGSIFDISGTQVRQEAQKRGLLNTTMALEAGQSAAIKNALEIAKPDAAAVAGLVGAGTQAQLDYGTERMAQDAATYRSQLDNFSQELIQRENFSTENRKLFADSMTRLGSQYSADLTRIVTDANIVNKQAAKDQLKDAYMSSADLMAKSLGIGLDWSSFGGGVPSIPSPTTPGGGSTGAPTEGSGDLDTAQLTDYTGKAWAQAMGTGKLSQPTKTIFPEWYKAEEPKLVDLYSKGGTVNFRSSQYRVPPGNLDAINALLMSDYANYLRNRPDEGQIATGNDYEALGAIENYYYNSAKSNGGLEDLTPPIIGGN